MILDCYQCRSCYFEDKDPSNRIDPGTISPPQPKRVFRNVLLVFACIEMYDSIEELEEAAEEFGSLSEMLGKRPIVLCPNVHLSIDKAPERQATWLIGELEKMLSDKGFDVHLLSFGYHKQYGMECNGNVGSIVGRRFYGSEQKQFLRLLTRLGVCPADSEPKDMPSWARGLSERRLKVLTSRSETYNVAKAMLSEQLDAAGHSELWTCMLFEGERKPVEDYLSALYEIIEDYEDVRMHRAFNLSLQGFSNSARFLFRKFPKAIESGRLRIYNSKVSDLEFFIVSYVSSSCLSSDTPKSRFACGGNIVWYLLQGRGFCQEPDPVVPDFFGRPSLWMDPHRGRVGCHDKRTGRREIRIEDRIVWHCGR